MQGKNELSASKHPLEQLSFLERESLIAASLGDYTGVTARPVDFWIKSNYISPISSAIEAPKVTPASSNVKVDAPWLRFTARPALGY